MPRRSLLLLLTLCLILSCRDRPPAGNPDELTIAAASSLRPAVDTLVEKWNRANPEIPARASFGASGTLYTQIDSRAPFDVFLSADDVYPQRLHRRGMGEEPFRYATGRIVCWVPHEIRPIEALEQLADARFRRIAIASPNLAPYGEAALEALERGGVYDDVKDRLVFATHVGQAAHYAESGGAEAALIPLSLATSTALVSKGRHLVVESALHDPILHEGLIITASPDRPAAERFVALLLGTEGRAVLAQHGFEPGDSRRDGTKSPQ